MSDPPDPSDPPDDSDGTGGSDPSDTHGDSDGTGGSDPSDTHGTADPSETRDESTAAEPPDDPEVLLTLPEERRGEFEGSMGPVFTDAGALLAAAGDPIVAVGDVVAAHLVRAGRAPDVALVDGRTERAPVAADVAEHLALADPDVTVANPPATLTRGLLVALADAVAAATDGDPARDEAGSEGPSTTTLLVEGEEDLAALPAVMAAPDGASVVYGQPGEGMVHVPVGPETRERARRGFDRLAGDHGAALAALGLEG